jgi:hypothetical protein
MLNAAREAAQMARGKTREDLDADRPLNARANANILTLSGF